MIEAHFLVRDDVRGIFGHSMGGHGALTLALRHPALYSSVSAFAPIVAPCEVPWGQKAFRGYLGDSPDEQRTWAEHDASLLVIRQSLRFKLPEILIDQGTSDKFLATELQPERFRAACASVEQPLLLRMQEGYDHSYYFIASFVEDHLRHHARLLMK
jgi:S-formylglutathione hydrolase